VFQDLVPDLQYVTLFLSYLSNLILSFFIFFGGNFLVLVFGREGVVGTVLRGREREKGGVNLITWIFRQDDMARLRKPRAECDG
jgi:hypothetical protein